jgi:GT2 family glycosyltransferase
MKQANKYVSIIIANYNGQKFLSQCLKSILQETGQYEIIIIDDGSIDQSVKLIENKFLTNQHVKLIKLPKNQGAANARNIGVKQSKGEYLLFLDNDTKIKPGWYKKIINFFKQQKNCGAAQVKLLTLKTNKFDSAGEYIGQFGFLVERAQASQDKGQFNQEKLIFSGKSAALLMKRKVFQKLSGFDQDYWIFLEDTDICWRTWLSGFEVRFAPKIIVEHAYQTKEKSPRFYINNQVYYRGCRNTVTTLIKNLNSKNLFIILPIHLASWFILAFIFLIKLDFTKSSALLRGLLWNFVNIQSTLKKRKTIQANRKITDKQLFALVGIKRPLKYYFHKAFAYLTNQAF